MVNPRQVKLTNFQDTLETPVGLGPRGTTRQGTYVLIMVDQDVQLEEGADRVQLLHYLQPNLFGSEILFFDATAPNASTAIGASYIAPNPPAGDIPHKYTFIMYRQPEGFEIPSEFVSINPPADVNARIGFDIAAFVQATNLGEPIGATWFQVQNNETDGSSTTTESSTESSTATTTGSGSETSSAESTGTSATTSATTTGGSSSTGTSASASATATGTDGNAAGMVTASGSLPQMAGAIILATLGFWFL